MSGTEKHECNTYIHPWTFFLNLDIGLYTETLKGLCSAFIPCIKIALQGG